MVFADTVYVAHSSTRPQKTADAQMVQVDALKIFVEEEASEYQLKNSRDSYRGRHPPSL